MSLFERLIIGNSENNIIPLTFIDNIMKALSKFIHNPEGNFLNFI